MRIDSETGAVDLPELGGALTPMTRRDEWLASPAAQGGDAGVHNELWYSYAARAFAVDGRPWTLRAWFHGQMLWRVEPMALGDEFGTSWSDWSETKEQARRAFQDQWLTQVLGPGRTFHVGHGGVHVRCARGIQQHPHRRCGP